MKHWNALQRLWTPFTRSPAAVYGTSACYYLLLSLIPAAVLLLHLVPQLPVDRLPALLPRQLQPMVAEILEQIQTAGSWTAASLSALLTLWPASKGILAIYEGINTVMGFPVSQRFFRRRLGAIALFLGLAAVLAGLFRVQQLGQLLVPGLFRFSWMAAVLFLWAFFALLYRLLPKRRVAPGPCVLGGLFAAAGWTALSWLFSLYIRYFSRYQQLYGSIGLLLLAFIWLKICMLLVFYGGILASLAARDAYHPVRILKEVFRNL